MDFRSTFLCQFHHRAASESWTRDLILTKDALYHWAKAATLFVLSGRRGSNPRPPAWKASALSTELLPQFTVLSLCRISFAASCSLKWWVVMDSNHRRRKPADLQSAPFGHSGNHPCYIHYYIYNAAPLLRHAWRLSLLSDSNQRPRDYKSRALANWAKEAKAAVFQLETVNSAAKLDIFFEPPKFLLDFLVIFLLFFIFG